MNALEQIEGFVDHKLNLKRYYAGEIENTGLVLQWPNLTNLYRPAKGTLNIITGIPSHGKSSFMDALMVSLTVIHGIKWAVFSPENYPTYLHIQKIMELYTGEPFFTEEKMSENTFTEAYQYFSDKMYFLNPGENELNLNKILSLAQIAIDIHDVNGIIIDPWNELIPEKEEGQNDSDFIGQSLSTCRRFARTHDILFYILAHPAKMYKKPEAVNYDIPTLYNISGSANWYNKADNGITVYRNFDNQNRENESVDIHVQKIKFKSHGRIGAIRFKYNFINGRFKEVDNGAQEKLPF